MAKAQCPAWLTYPRDHLGDRHVRLMSWAARGIWHELKCHYWISGDLPDDPKELAKMIGASEKEFASAWPQIRPALKVTRKGWLRVPDLFGQKMAQEVRRKTREEAGKMGGSKRWKSKELNSKATILPSQKDSSSISSSISNSNTTAPNPSSKEGDRGGGGNPPPTSPPQPRDPISLLAAGIGCRFESVFPGRTGPATKSLRELAVLARQQHPAGAAGQVLNSFLEALGEYDAQVEHLANPIAFALEVARAGNIREFAFHGVEGASARRNRRRVP